MDPKELKRIRIAKRIAQEFPDGALVNLGIGMPTLVADHVPPGRTILLQSENGFIGLGPQPEKGKECQSLVNAGGQAVTIVPGGCFFDSAMSFAIIRGGHVDYTVLGVLENMSAGTRAKGADAVVRRDPGLERALGRPAALLKTAFAADLARAAAKLGITR